MLSVRVAAASAALRDTRGWSIRMFQPTAASWLPCVCSRGPVNSSSWMRNRCSPRGRPSRRNLCASSRRSAMRPEWSADGTALIFASDRDGGPFELYETSSLDRVQEPQRVLRVTGGARSPALAPDGRVVFVGYTAQGFDLFESRIAMHGDTGGARPHGGFDTAVATPLGRIAMRVDTDGATPSGRVAMRFDDKYRPWPTLLPHGWLPLTDRRDGRWRLGAVVTGYDVLGRHVIAADATWAVNA